MHGHLNVKISHEIKAQWCTLQVATITVVPSATGVLPKNFHRSVKNSKAEKNHPPPLQKTFRESSNVWECQIACKYLKFLLVMSNDVITCYPKI
jgi:hypothetical protein